MKKLKSGLIEKEETMPVPELKRCPFCGQKVAELIDTVGMYGDDTSQIRDMYTVVCNTEKGGCGATAGWRFHEEDAVKAWNERFEDD